MPPTAGQAFHVIEEHRGNSRVFAFAPGQQTHPVAVQRRFTLIKERNLDLEEFAAENRAAANRGAKKVDRINASSPFRHQVALADTHKSDHHKTVTG